MCSIKPFRRRSPQIKTKMLILYNTFVCFVYFVAKPNSSLIRWLTKYSCSPPRNGIISCAQKIESRLMDKNAELKLNGKDWKLPIIEGTEQERAVDISSLRNDTGFITLDDGYGNTGSCLSTVTFLDGQKGILRYRGIPIEELAEKSTFIEVAHLLIMSKLPTSAELRRF